MCLHFFNSAVIANSKLDYWSLIGKKNDNLPEESSSQLAGFSKDEMNNTALMYSDIFIPVTRAFTSSKVSAFPLPDDNNY